jgi:hypothetical protein
MNKKTPWSGSSYKVAMHEGFEPPTDGLEGIFPSLVKVR